MEPNEQSFIHDHFFKGSMQQIEIAQGLSQLLLSKRIPVRIDYTTMQIVKDSWINVRLDLHSTDILYRAEAGLARLHLLLLFEHKSNIDNLVSLQNYRNTSYVIEEEQSQSKSSIPKLPPVIPIVIYHGKTPWDIDNSIAAMFEYCVDPQKGTVCHKKNLCPIKFYYLTTMPLKTSNSRKGFPDGSSFLMIV